MILTYKYRKAAIGLNAKAICDAYTAGRSSAQVAKAFGISSRSVLNLLRERGIPIRSRAEGNALRWKECDFRSNQVAKRAGKPSGAAGKRWHLSRPKFSPAVRGSRNPSWKGGRLSLQLEIRHSGTYSFWRRSVFVRDGFTCVACGSKGDRLAADHIYPFAKILDDHRISTLDQALACGALWRLENGRTLCDPCHRQTETFGRKKSVAAHADGSRRAA